jgi:hypothetical protein
MSETFVVDPTLSVLPSLSEPLLPKETQKNLEVMSSSGRVNASIDLIDGVDQAESTKSYTSRGHPISRLDDDVHQVRQMR